MKRKTKPTYSEFSEPRLTAIYDAVNPIGGYRDFFVNKADKLSASTIADIGCGTGLLSHELAIHGHSVIGIEPGAAMLREAERKYGAEVKWIVGSTEKLQADMQIDLAIMAGHVAQFFLTDLAWREALGHIYAALKPGGYLIFESRNPLVRPFTSWPTKDKPRRISDTPLGPVEWWPNGLHFDNNKARYEIHYRFHDGGEEFVSVNELIFRTKDELSVSLQEAGFRIEHIYGDWDDSLLTADSPEMIFVARRK